MQLLAVVAYLAVITFWIYAVADTQPGGAEWTFWLVPFLVLLHVGVGAAVGRWWAVLLPALVVLISVPAGYAEITPENAEPLPIWFGLLFALPLAVPLVAVGVAGRKIRTRQTGAPSRPI